MKLFRQRGAAAVELAILAIPLLLILAGVAEFGRAMVYYNTIVKSARDAARLMSTQTPSDPDYGTLSTSAACTVVHGNTACTGQPLLPGLTTAMVSICDPLACAGTHGAVPTGTGAANLVTVTVAGYTFPSVGGFLAGLTGTAVLQFPPIQATMRQVL